MTANVHHRLEESLGKLREVERDREHWRLELQLLNIKMEKHKAQPSAVHEEKLEVRKPFRSIEQTGLDLHCYL